MATKQKTSTELLDEVIAAALSGSEDFQDLAAQFENRRNKEHQEDMRRIRERHLAPIVPLWT